MCTHAVPVRESNLIILFSIPASIKLSRASDGNTNYRIKSTTAEFSHFPMSLLGRLFPGIGRMRTISVNRQSGKYFSVASRIYRRRMDVAVEIANGLWNEDGCVQIFIVMPGIIVVTHSLAIIRNTCATTYLYSNRFSPIVRHFVDCTDMPDGVIIFRLSLKYARQRPIFDIR